MLLQLKIEKLFTIAFIQFLLSLIVDNNNINKL